MALGYSRYPNVLIRVNIKSEEIEINNLAKLYNSYDDPKIILKEGGKKSNG